MPETLTQVNHTIFEKKHHYMSAMREVEILKRQMEYEALQESIPKERLTETYRTRALIFTGLLREGLQYQYIQSAEEPERDVIRITIDNVNYDCDAKMIMNVMREGFTKEIPESQGRLEYKKDDSRKTVNNTSTNVINTEKSSAIDALMESVQDDTSTEVNDIVALTAAPETNINMSDNVVNDTKPEKPLSEKYDEIAEDDNRRKSDRFVFDTCKVSAIMDGGSRGDDFKFMIAPLYIYQDNAKPDIVVWARKENTIICDVTKNDKKVVKIDIEGHSFLIHGSFHNGNFQSYIHAAGLTLSAGYNLKIETERHRDEYAAVTGRAGTGHVSYTDNGNKFHVFPTSLSNEANGNATCVIVTEVDGKREASLLPDLYNSKKTFYDGRYSMYNYWENDCLVSELIDESKEIDKDIKKRQKKDNFNKILNIADRGLRSLIKLAIALVVAGVLFLGVKKICTDQETKNLIIDKIDVLLHMNEKSTEDSFFEDTQGMSTETLITDTEAEMLGF